MLVQEGLQINRLAHPDKTALVCGGRRFTYAEVDAMADRLANALLANGVKRGDRVAIFLPNSIEAVIGIFAALKAGAVFVVINHSTKFDKLSYILGDCQATALITASQVAAQGTVLRLCKAHESLKCTILTGSDAADR